MGGFRGSFYFRKPIFFLRITLNSEAHKEGLGRGKRDPGGLSRIDRQKGRAGSALCPPGREPALRRPGNTSCFFHCPSPRFPAVHFLFLAPFNKTSRCRVKKDREKEGCVCGGSIRAQLILNGLCMQLKT